jgi:hypothetical protein
LDATGTGGLFVTSHIRCIQSGNDVTAPPTNETVWSVYLEKIKKSKTICCNNNDLFQIDNYSNDEKMDFAINHLLSIDEDLQSK